MFRKLFIEIIYDNGHFLSSSQAFANDDDDVDNGNNDVDDGSGDDYDSLVVVKALELMRFWVPNIGLHCFFRLYLVSSSQKLGLMSQMSDSG